MLKDHLIHLFKYNSWATAESAQQVINEQQDNRRIFELLSHIVNSQRVWLNRALQRNVFPDPWEKHMPEECIRLSIAITSDWINFLESIEEIDLDKIIKYKNNKGEEWENTIGDIVTHIINHSTYNRAQIAQLLRQSGKQPPKTDYIAYQRTLHS